MQLKTAFVFVVVVFTVAAPRSLADALIVIRAMSASTIAEVFVESDTIVVDLEIGMADVPGFRNLLPDEVYERLGYEPEAFHARLDRFFTQDWVLRADGGEPLVGQVREVGPRLRVQRDEITGEPLSTRNNDEEFVVAASIEYALTSRPERISIAPPRSAEHNLIAATIGFVAYHSGVAVNDFRYLSQPETLELDWDDPWFSRFKNSNLKRQYDAPMSAFLYVDHFEVRKEIVLRPKDLQHWINVGLADAAVIPVERQEDIKHLVAEFLADRGPVLIDGRQVMPVLDRVHFIRRTLRKTGVIDPPEELDINSALLGIIFAYPVTSLPQEVSMTWDLFSPRIERLPTVATDEAGGLPFTLTPDDPVLLWQNFLTNPSSPELAAVTPPPSGRRVRVPLISAVCVALGLCVLVSGWRRRLAGPAALQRGAAGCAVALTCAALTMPFAGATLSIPLMKPGTMASPEASSVVTALLNNIYRAFDRREEDIVYDRLARCVSGGLLSDVYLQTRRSMELEGQGGARVKVNEVILLEAGPTAASAAGGFVQQCSWQVTGSVGHWGHIHQRSNRYEAVFTVEVLNGAWKIVDIDLRDQQRVFDGKGSKPS